MDNSSLEKSCGFFAWHIKIVILLRGENHETEI